MVIDETMQDFYDGKRWKRRTDPPVEESKPYIDNDGVLRHTFPENRDKVFYECCKHCENHVAPKKNEHLAPCRACTDVALKTDKAKSDPVEHPAHYTSHPSGVECIEVTEWMNFNLGNAMKYIWRAGDKGNTIEDLKKSVWYVQREIARLENLS